MFFQTFYNCSGLTSIPANLFSGIQGVPAGGMFARTFYNCSSLTSIGYPFVGVFSDTISRHLDFMRETFSGCINLTGPSAKMADGRYLYEYWLDNANLHPDYYGKTYHGATKLDDYESMPSGWK
jgi:hypothetical protein